MVKPTVLLSDVTGPAFSRTIAQGLLVVAVASCLSLFWQASVSGEDVGFRSPAPTELPLADGSRAVALLR